MKLTEIKNASTFQIISYILALFLLVLSIVEVSNFWLSGAAFDASYILRPAVALLYTVFWFYGIRKQKWGMIGFVALTVISWLALLFAKDNAFNINTLSIFRDIIPINIILSILLLLFFKKPQTQEAP